jgi:hypothetical protein
MSITKQLKTFLKNESTEPEIRKKDIEEIYKLVKNLSIEEFQKLSKIREMCNSVRNNRYKNVGELDKLVDKIYELIETLE